MARSASEGHGAAGPLHAGCTLLLIGLRCPRSSPPFPPPLARAARAPRGYKMAGDATQMRIVMNFDREPDPKWFLLRGPHRLVDRSAATPDSPSMPGT